MSDDPSPLFTLREWFAACARGGVEPKRVEGHVQCFDADCPSFDGPDTLVSANCTHYHRVAA